MTTPTGTIAMSDVNVELSKASTALITFDDTDVRNLAGVLSGQISMDDMRGKSAVNYGTLTPSLSTVAEGGSVTFTLAGGTLPNGTYYWRVDYVSNLDAADFVATQGSFSVAGNTGSFSVSTVNDTLDEGDGVFRVLLGDVSGVPVAYVSSSNVTVTETTTYTAQAITTNNVYRYGPLASRWIIFGVDTTQVQDGTTIYWNILNVTGTVDTTDIDALSGSFSIGSNEGGSLVTVASVTDGSTKASKSFRFRFYTDAARTNLVATSGTVTIRAAPTYALSFSPTSINEGQTTTGTITTTNYPPNNDLYFTTSGTASATADWLGGVASGNVAMPTGTSNFLVTAAYDGTVESNETLTFSLRTVSTSGTVVGTATVTFVQALGTVTTLTASKTGGATLGSNVTVTLRIASIPAYPADRTFNITYSVNGGAYTNAAPLLATTITVAANATSSSTITVVNRTSDTALSSLIFRVALTGHTTKDSNTLSGGYI